jgi:VWFA-related protein
MTGRIATGIVIATLTAAVAGQQAQSPGGATLPDVTFTVDVNYVEVDAVVTDAAGRPVTDLTAGDFELLEDGKPQTISGVSFVDVPIERTDRPVFASGPIDRDVVANDGSEGRLYLLVLDDLHTAAPRSVRVRQVARTFIERYFGANDYAAVVYTGGRDVDGQDFTNDRHLLLAAIDRFAGQKLPSATAAKIRVMQSAPRRADGTPDPRAMPPSTRPAGRVPPGTDPNDPNIVETLPNDPLAYERSIRARLVMGRMRQLAEFMAGVRGRRKALLMFSEGVEFDVEESVGSASSDLVVRETDDAIAAAARGNVVIYGIDPRAGGTIDDELMHIDNSGSSDMGLGMASLRREMQIQQSTLQFLAAGTGGFAAVNQNTYGRVFDRVVRENSSYYLLGFYPANSRREGKYRRIDVRVKRPGLKVTRARDGYREPRATRAVASAAPASPAERNPALGLTSPLPLSGLPIKLFAGTYRAGAAQAMVALSIEVDVSTLDFDERDGLFTQQLDVGMVAIDPRGEIRQQSQQTVDLSFTKERLDAVRREGVRVITGMTLERGRYQLRVAVGTASGRMGSVLRDLTIPDFTAPPLAMSSVSLTSQLATAMPTTSRVNFLNLSLRGPVTARREFRRSDEITVYAEVYENELLDRHMIELRTRARGGDGEVAFSLTDQLWSADRKASGAYSHWARIPVSDLAPGDYVLELEAKSLAEPMRVVKREIAIRVRE